MIRNIASHLPATVLTNDELARIYPGWLSDLINEHQCGIAVPPQDPEALADALCKLADNERSRKAMGVRARALALDVYPREKIAARFAKTIETL